MLAWLRAIMWKYEMMVDDSFVDLLRIISKFLTDSVNET